jgi:methyl-accepting chemotaxis protein
VLIQTVRGQLALTFAFALLGMLIMVLSQFLFAKELDLHSNILKKIHRLDTNMLQMRQNEKNFLQRKEVDYIQAFDADAKAFNTQLHELILLLHQEEFSHSEVEVLDSFEAYKAGFHQMSALMKRIGLSETEGYTAELTGASLAMQEYFLDEDADEKGAVRGRFIRADECPSHFIVADSKCAKRCDVIPASKRLPSKTATLYSHTQTRCR